MPRNDTIDPRTPSSAPDRASDSRKPYAPPVLRSVGDLRSLTLGGSPGVNDSGPNFFNQKPPGAP